MKKKLVALALVGALAFSLTIPSVSAFAMSALSQFRGSSTKTISVTVEDMYHMQEYGSKAMEKYAAENAEEIEKFHDSLENEELKNELYDFENEMKEPAKLENIQDFTAFKVKLPKSFTEKQPEMFSTELVEKTIEGKDGESLSFAVSPMFLAAYDNTVLIATKGINTDFPSEKKAELKEMLLESPMLTDNLRTQIEAIDPDSGDIYLPVVPGISRDVKLGSSTGYFYGIQDFIGIADSMNEEYDIAGEYDEDAAEIYADEEYALAAETASNQDALIWTKDGILYVLISDLSDAEMASIARSIG